MLPLQNGDTSHVRLNTYSDENYPNRDTKKPELLREASS